MAAPKTAPKTLDVYVIDPITDLYQLRLRQAIDMAIQPFQQRPFETLPARPHRAHNYFETESHELTMESESFGKLNAHYRTAGEGPPLLLIHGLMTSSYSWRYLLSPLSKSFRLYIPDLPGAGKSSKVQTASYDPKNLALWINEFQEDCKIQGCPIIGNSLGGYLAMQLAMQSPKAMSRLINIHSPGFPTIKLRLLHFVLKFPAVRKLLTALVQKNPEKWAHKNVHYYDESLKSFEEATEYGRPLRELAGIHTFIAYLFETLAPRSLREFVKELKKNKETHTPFPVPLL